MYTHHTLQASVGASLPHPQVFAAEASSLWPHQQHTLSSALWSHHRAQFLQEAYVGTGPSTVCAWFLAHDFYVCLYQCYVCPVVSPQVWSSLESGILSFISRFVTPCPVIRRKVSRETNRRPRCWCKAAAAGHSGLAIVFHDLPPSLPRTLQRIHKLPLAASCFQ